MLQRLQLLLERPRDHNQFAWNPAKFAVRLAHHKSALICVVGIDARNVSRHSIAVRIGSRVLVLKSWHCAPIRDRT
jgi:hypothetical protein